MLLYFIRGIFVVTIIAVLFIGINYPRSLEERTPNEEELYKIGVDLYQQGQYKEAAEKLRQSISAETDMDIVGQNVMAIFIIGVSVAVIVVALDWLTPKASLNALAGVFFGLLVGALLSYAMSPILVMMNNLYFHMGNDSLQMSKWIMAICICYLSVSLVIRTKDDVRFVIPYVEFSRQTKGQRPFVLDTSVIIDGRIYDVSETKLFDSPLVVPRFVLNELQLISDSPDKMKRTRGRRGLDMLNKLQNSPAADIIIDDTPPPGIDSHAPVDQKLVAFSKNCDGRLVTNDFNLNKVAQLRGVDVININDLANAMKTVLLPGERLKIKIMKAGDSGQQGVGYLEDGTMVVVEDARGKINQMIPVTVTSLHQTSAGKMVFGKCANNNNA